jgi:SAM-dependent methyltransferase
VFEVGCGAGNRISYLTKRMRLDGALVEAVGCDYSSHALKEAAKKEINVIHGGLDEIASKGSADILILSHVFEHFPDPLDAMRKIEKLLHGHSLIYIEVPGVIDLKNKKEYLYDYQLYNVLAHTYNFSLGTLSNIMAKCGFTLLDGDEYVRAIFTKGQSGQRNGEYDRIMFALSEAHKKGVQLKALRNNPMVKYLRNLAKAVLGREG